MNTLVGSLSVNCFYKRTSKYCSFLAVCAFLVGVFACSVTFAADVTEESSTGNNILVSAQKKGPFKVRVETYIWKDESREGREIPVKIYIPEGKGNCPLVITSHGLGGSRDGLAYVGNYWASHGIVSLHPQHHGSDRDVIREGRLIDARKRLQDKLKEPETSYNRPLDVFYCIDEALTLTVKGSTQKLVDPEKIGMAGHSFGAWTTMACIGQESGALKMKGVKADPRIKAAIPMSASYRPSWDYSKVNVPVFHMTGTKDNSPIALTTAADRRGPFDSITHAEQYLIIIKDGDHGVFSGKTSWKTDKRYPEWHRYIETVSTIFWKAYLEDDKRALDFLRGEGLKKISSPVGELEHKNAK